MPPEIEPFRFDDATDESQYYFKPVYWAVDNEITNGATPTTFNPGAGCTRAQVVTFLWRSAGKPEPMRTTNPFDDVQDGQYFTKGNSADKYSPNTTCTRGQILTFLYRALADAS